MDDAGEMEDDNDVMLATISRHELSLECSCGHTGVVSVQDCLVTFGLRATVAEVAAGTRCGDCGAKSAQNATVIYGGQKGRKAAKRGARRPASFGKQGRSTWGHIYSTQFIIASTFMGTAAAVCLDGCAGYSPRQNFIVLGLMEPLAGLNKMVSGTGFQIHTRSALETTTIRGWPSYDQKRA